MYSYARFPAEAHAVQPHTTPCWPSNLRWYSRHPERLRGLLAPSGVAWTTNKNIAILTLLKERRPQQSGLETAPWSTPWLTIGVCRARALGVIVIASFISWSLPPINAVLLYMWKPKTVGKYEKIYCKTPRNVTPIFSRHSSVHYAASVLLWRISRRFAFTLPTCASVLSFTSIETVSYSGFEPGWDPIALINVPLCQGCTTRGPRAGSGPRRSFIRPSEQVKKIQETSPEWRRYYERI